MVFYSGSKLVCSPNIILSFSLSLSFPSAKDSPQRERAAASEVVCVTAVVIDTVPHDMSGASVSYLAMSYLAVLAFFSLMSGPASC